MKRRLRALEARNPHAVGIWGRGGVRHLLAGWYIFPVPFTRYTYWVRRHEWRIFHITSFDLVD
jgi:hypothetical protein